MLLNNPNDVQTQKSVILFKVHSVDCQTFEQGLKVTKQIKLKKKKNHVRFEHIGLLSLKCHILSNITFI